ncbi:MAG: hypothetical protein XD63_0663 [Thermoanaerobacterales bacterium 50_218]|nr:MAG: hypothetical protein XD63_0663 [Thermoanaerobacterales bacterium 50_218]
MFYCENTELERFEKLMKGEASLTEPFVGETPPWEPFNSDCCGGWEVQGYQDGYGNYCQDGYGDYLPPFGLVEMCAVAVFGALWLLWKGLSWLFITIVGDRKVGMYLGEENGEKSCRSAG